MPSVLLVDPLSLPGRELLEVLPRVPSLSASVRYLHTEADSEHQIAELGGEPGLVPPLDSPEDLAGADVVVVASPALGPRAEHLLSFLDQRPEALVVDLGRCPTLHALTVPACPGLERTTSSRHLRVPHPAATVAGILCAPALPLGLVSVSLVALDPVSEVGSGAVELLASQSIAMLQGLEPEQLIDGRVRAFTLHAAADDRLSDDARVLLEGIDVAASRVLTGCFHGHMVQLTLGFDPPPTAAALAELWRGAGQVELAGHSLSTSLVVGRDTVLLDSIAVTSRGSVTVTAAVDGLRVGGAVTAVGLMIELLRH